jgi:sulfate-transporting ATPase
VPALAAALLTQFRSFSVTLVVALVLGIASAEIGFYVSQPGWATAAPFIAVIAVLTIRGRHLPLRSYVLDRLPRVGTGRIAPVPAAVLYVVGAAVCLSASSAWAVYLTTNLTIAIICLSTVLITGYAGQLSLAQAVLAGAGALAAAWLSPHVPFIIAIVFGAAIAGVGGLLVGIPALRTRGATLAIATLALGAAVSDVLINGSSYDGGSQGFTISTPSLFGWDINPLFHDNRYAFVTLTILFLLALMMSNLRVVGRHGGGRGRSPGLLAARRAGWVHRHLHRVHRDRYRRGDRGRRRRVHRRRDRGLPPGGRGDCHQDLRRLLADR